jgi:hypothetical protein
MCGPLRVILALVVLGVLAGCTEEAAEGEPVEVFEPGPLNVPPRECVWLLKGEERPDYCPPESADDGATIDQPSVYSGNDLDCEDFSSRAEAQAYLEANPAGADYLDGGGDGIACEWGTN